MDMTTESTAARRTAHVTWHYSAQAGRGIMGVDTARHVQFYKSTGDSVQQVQGERAVRTPLAARPVKTPSFDSEIGLFDTSHQKIKLLERHADGGSEGAELFDTILKARMVC